GAGGWPNDHRGFRRTLLHESHHGTQAGIVVFTTDRRGVDHDQVRPTKDDRLVQAGGIVVEEADGAPQPVIEPRRKLVITRQAIEDRRARHRPRKPSKAHSWAVPPHRPWRCSDVE